MPTLNIAVLHILGEVFLHANPSELQPHCHVHFDLQNKIVLAQNDNDYLTLSGMRGCPCAQVTKANPSPHS